MPALTTMSYNLPIVTKGLISGGMLFARFCGGHNLTKIRCSQAGIAGVYLSR